MCVDIQDAFTAHACVCGRAVHCCTVMADDMHMLKVCFGASGLACLWVRVSLWHAGVPAALMPVVTCGCHRQSMW